MLFRRLVWFLRKLFITATFTLPEWKDSIRIGLALINCATRGNYLTAAHRADSAARRAALDINLKLFGYVSHPKKSRENIADEASALPFHHFRFLKAM